MTRSGVENGGRTVSPSNQNETGPWNLITQASAILAVVASGAYALGLFSVWIPLVTAYTSDMTSAWYVAGLVPRNVVLGQGVNKLLAPPIVLWLLTEALMIALYLVWQLVGKAGGRRSRLVSVCYISLLGGIFVLWGGIFVLWLVFFYVPLSFPIFPLSLQTFDLTGISRGQWIATGACFGLMIITALLPLLVRFIRDGEVAITPISSFPEVASTQHLGDGASFRRALRAILTERFGRGFAPVLRRAAAFVLMAFFFGLVGIVLFQEPPLPKVVVTKASSAHGPKEVRGLLLVHTEGFWHVMKDGGQYSGAMVAIPDDDAAEVRIPAKFEKGP
jgi:hypothetical protein